MGFRWVHCAEDGDEDCASMKESAYHFGAFPLSFLRMRILARPLPKWTAPYHAMSALPPSGELLVGSGGVYHGSGGHRSPAMKLS